MLACLALFVWFGCGVLAYGFELGYWYRRYPWKSGLRWPLSAEFLAGFAFLLGPSALAAQAICFRFRYGLLWREPDGLPTLEEYITGNYGVTPITKH
jgi:hypothetical protein